MKVTKRWLKKHEACSKAIKWFVEQKRTDHESLLQQLIKDKKPIEWGNWYISKRLPGYS